MEIFYPLNNERGLGVVAYLFLLFLVTSTVAGTGGYLAIRVAQQEEQPVTDYIDALEQNKPITDEMQDRATKSFHNKFQVLAAGGNLINSVDVAPSPDSSAAVSAWAMNVTGTYVDQASNPRRPASDKPLPRCMSGTFTCANGTIICANEVCNAHDDCGDNSDERNDMCNTESSCCLSTNGCPGETATSCAETCCCCPYGMICDRQNPANGCVASQ